MHENGGGMMLNEEEENLYGDEEMLLQEGDGMAVQDYGDDQLFYN